MLRAIHGPDTFTAREKLRGVLSACLGEAGDVSQVKWLEGKTATPGEIVEACGQVSMFASTNVVVVDGLLSRFSSDGPRKKPAKARKRSPKTDAMGEWAEFGDRVRSLPESSVLILIDGELKGTNTLLESLSLEPGEEVRCPPLGENDVVGWIKDRVTARKGRIDHDAAQRLWTLVGADLWLLSSEIEKLVLYADGVPIHSDMVDHMIASAATPTIFMLVDAIVERSARLARHRLDDMYRQGLSAGYVFTMLARQFRIIAQIIEARQHRGAPSASAELARLHSFALQRATRQAERYKEPGIRHALERLAAADRSMKTGVYSDQMALEMLVTELLQPPSA